MKIKNWYLLVIVFLSLAAQAAPYKYANCKGVSIQTPKDSAPYYFDEKDCKTIYVLPPEEGSVRITSYSPQYTDAQCQTTQHKLASLQTEAAAINDIVTEIDKQRKIYEKLNSQTTAKLAQCRQHEDDVEDAKEKVLQLKNQQDQVAQMKQEMLDLKKQCEENKKSNCTKNDRKMDKLDKAASEIKLAIIQMTGKQNSAQIRLDGCNSRARNSNTDIEKQRADALKEMDELNETLSEKSEDYDKKLKSETEVAGATMGVTFSTSMTKAVEAYKKANPGINVMTMPLEAMKIQFSAVVPGGSVSFPVVIGTDIYGIDVEKAPTTDSSVLNVSDTERRNLFMGPALSGQIVINRLAACNSNGGVNKNFSDLIRASVYYEYGVVTKRTYKVDYLEKQLYRMIRESTTDKGFFRSSSSTSITSSVNAKRWIDIQFDAEDLNNGFQDPIKMAQEIRNEMLSSALKAVTLAFTGENNPNLPPPSKTGGEQLAEDAHKCPDWRCQAAGFVLDIGNAVFGGSDSSNQVTKSANAQFKEKFTETKPVSQYGTMAFKIEDAGG